MLRTLESTLISKSVATNESPNMSIQGPSGQPHSGPQQKRYRTLSAVEANKGHQQLSGQNFLLFRNVFELRRMGRFGHECQLKM